MQRKKKQTKKITKRRKNPNFSTSELNEFVALYKELYRGKNQAQFSGTDSAINQLLIDVIKELTLLNDWNRKQSIILSGGRRGFV